jgi:uncharacterized protein DUF4082/PEP-CTERM motif-containing protein
MRRLIRRSMLAVAVLKLMAGGVAQADLVLEFNPTIGPQLVSGDTTGGWSFTTTQAIIVTALDVYDPTGYGNVRLYDGSGHILASATLTTADAREGSPIPFYTQAVTPVTLAANQTYYVAEDILANTTQFYVRTGTPTTSPLITYGANVVHRGAGGSPTTDEEFGGSLNPGFFGPNFDAVAAGANAVPEPSTAVVAVLGAVAFLAYGWSRNRRHQRRQAAA